MSQARVATAYPAEQESSDGPRAGGRVLWLMCYALLLAATCAVRLLALMRAALPARRQPAEKRILLTGMFASNGWTEAHVRPVALSKVCREVWVVADQPMLDLPKTRYACAPQWLQRIIGRAAARAAWCVITAVRVRPHAVGGFHMLFNGVVALAAARLVGARAMYFCVGGWTELRGGGACSEAALFNRLGRECRHLEKMLVGLVGQMDLILTMGEGTRQILRRAGMSQPIEVMSGGIDPHEFKTGGADKLYDLIYVGRLAPIKRPDVLLDAVALLKKTMPEVRVAMVGDGPLLENMKKRAKELQLTENVHFAGQQQDVGAWLRQSRVFVLTSDSEGVSLAMLEAMMAGLPAVVSDVGDLGDAVENGVNGWLAPRRNPAAFAEHARALLADGDLYASFSRKARRAAARYSTWTAARKWEMLLSQTGDGR